MTPDLWSRLRILLMHQDLVHGVLLQFHLLIWIILKSSCLSTVFSDDPTGHSAHHFACHPPPSRFQVFSSSSPRCQTSLVSCHARTVSILRFFRHPVQGPGHPRVVVAHFHSRTLDFPQHTRSSSWQSLSRPGRSVCSMSLVLNIIHFQPIAPKIDNDFTLSYVKCLLTCLPVLVSIQFTSQPKTYIQFHERIFMFIRGSFNRHRIW